MATTDSMMAGEFSTQISNGNSSGGNVNLCSKGSVTAKDDLKSQDLLRCFVCDAKVHGRHYALATCRTQCSRSKVIEKLGELVGERYMVVISEDDIICRSCANLINTLDRLETEMHTVRDNILRFLERKYSLEEGELLGDTTKPKPFQPPQITKRNTSSNNWNKGKESSLSFNTLEKAKNKKSNVWMQCDKCKYTTHYNSFMIHHIRDHVKQKRSCDKCGVQFLGGQQAVHECKINEQKIEFECVKEQRRDHVLVKFMNNESVNASNIEADTQPSSSLTAVQYQQPQTSKQNENIPLIRFSNPEYLYMQNVLTMEDNNMPCQPMYIRVLQHVNVNDGIAHSSIPSTDSERDIISKMKDSEGKQLLTLTEDGNLEMVDVSCWNNIQPPDPGSAMQFS